MIRQRVSFAVAGAIVATTALTAGLASPASAADTPYDPAFVPGSGDLVGVGSDTIEIALDYLTKGHSGDLGFNNTPANTFDVASWAAAGTPATISLREGHAAITRPNGSSSGKALLYGPGNNTDVNFARSSSSLNTAEKEGELRQFPFAVDGLKLAVDATATNAPATITPAQLVQIYSGAVTNWSQIGGTSGVIKPYVPQAGSGTLKFFTDQLTAANGGTAVTLAGSVGVAQEHDDTLIKDDPNAVAPFSTARAKALTSTIKLTKGFKAYRAVYNVVRNADLSDITLGPKLNAVFSSAGFICSPAGKTLIEAAGFDQLATPANGGVCGVPTQEATSSFVTTSQVDTDTTLVATEEYGYKVKLTATVDAASSPVGSVIFKEGANPIGSPVEVVDGVATKNLTLVPKGDHSYSAEFVPDSIGAFTPSNSGTVTTSVKTPALVTAGLLNPTSTYGSNRLLAVAASVDGEPATGSVNISVDGGTPVAAPLLAGAAFYTIPGTSPVGAHSVKVTLPGGAEYNSASRTIPMTVTKATTKTSFKFVDATISASTTPKTTVTVAINGAASTIKPSGKVTLRYGTKIVGTGTVTNGVAKVSLSKFKKRSTKYGIKATFTSTNSNYSSSPASATVYLKVS